MFSKELQIMDRNTTQLMIDEQQKTIDELKYTTEKLQATIDNQNDMMSQLQATISEQNRIITQLRDSM